MGTGPRMIDPETGLELEVLTPTPATWSADSVRGKMLAADPTQGGLMAGENPFLATMEVNQPIPDPSLSTTVPESMAPGATAAPASGGQLRPSSLLDMVVHTLFGTPDSKLSPEEESEKHAKRNDMAALSKSAAENPGAAHMGIPSVSGGSSLGEALGFLPGLIKGIGGIF